MNQSYALLLCMWCGERLATTALQAGWLPAEHWPGSVPFPVSPALEQSVQETVWICRQDGLLLTKRHCLSWSSSTSFPSAGSSPSPHLTEHLRSGTPAVPAALSEWGSSSVDRGNTETATASAPARFQLLWWFLLSNEMRAPCRLQTRSVSTRQGLTVWPFTSFASGASEAGPLPTGCTHGPHSVTFTSRSLRRYLGNLELKESFGSASFRTSTLKANELH